MNKQLIPHNSLETCSYNPLTYSMMPNQRSLTLLTTQKVANQIYISLAIFTFQRIVKVFSDMSLTMYVNSSMMSQQFTNYYAVPKQNDIS